MKQRKYERLSLGPSPIIRFSFLLAYAVFVDAQRAKHARSVAAGLTASIIYAQTAKNSLILPKPQKKSIPSGFGTKHPGIQAQK